MREWTQRHIEELINSIFDKKIKPYKETIQLLYDYIINNQTTSIEGGNDDETK